MYLLLWNQWNVVFWESVTMHTMKTLGGKGDGAWLCHFHRVECDSLLQFITS